ncbi:MAG: response regulator transcription factor, partial [Clostridia bacterium]|nr:response regulator transcription factor [Clostridia bacterium]
PDGDGFRICREIRSRSDVPVIFLTACDDEIHTVLGLEQGADDYIAKPFRIRELLARIKAVLRRRGGNAAVRTEPEKVSVGRNEVDLSSGKVFRDGEEVFLSAAEYRLLLTFIRNRGQLLTRRQILSEMWDSAGDFVNDNTLTVYVRRLRKKLGDEGEDGVIRTVRGLGYRMEV